MMTPVRFSQLIFPLVVTLCLPGLWAQLPQNGEASPEGLELIMTHVSPSVIMVSWRVIRSGAAGNAEPPSGYTLDIEPDAAEAFPINVTSGGLEGEYSFTELRSATHYTISLQALDEAGHVYMRTSLQRQTSENPCISQPCHNGGTCQVVISIYSAYVCFCPPCYTGSDCETSLNVCDTQPCLNSGKCEVKSGTCDDYICRCDGCYGGERCEIDMDPCAEDPCRKDGFETECTPRDDNSCQAYDCFCRNDQGCFVGKNCQQRFDPCYPNPCGRGQCLRDASACNYTCTCPGCYTGADCSVLMSPCEGNPCGEHGLCYRDSQSCIKYSCVCDECYAGQNCEKYVHDPCLFFTPCRNGGVCVSSPESCMEYVCECPACYTGTFCEQAIDPCESNPCVNDGVCTTDPQLCTEHICECKRCFSGDNCEVDEGACASSPCNHGGDCMELENDCSEFTCSCSWAWLGKTCSWHLALVIILAQLSFILIIWAITMTLVLCRRRRSKPVESKQTSEESHYEIELAEEHVIPTDKTDPDNTANEVRRRGRRHDRDNYVDGIDELGNIEGDDSGITSARGAKSSSAYNELSSLTRDFASNTTWHGLPRICAAKTKGAMSVWAIVCATALAFFLWQGSTMLMRYLTFPIDISITEVPNSELVFPAVTICNTNKLKVSALENSRYFKFVAMIQHGDFTPYYVPCEPGDFKCNSGIHCVKRFLVCDGIYHCPDTSDEFGCEYNHYACSRDQFKCASGGQMGICIPRTKRCDGIEDCYQGEDEVNCDYKNASPNHCTGFYCDDGLCQPLEAKCNYVSDCVDGTDEEGCKFRDCQPWEFKCDNHRCIKEEAVCNWRDDCGDNSDEATCVYRECTAEEFRCSNSECIAGWKRCNSYIDCGDHSDEKDCTNNIYCTDCNELCPNWAQRGECETNSMFMKSCCRLSCGLCEGQNVFADEKGECPEGFFKCNSSFCIDAVHVCDTHSNCIGSEDEYWPECVYRAERKAGREVLFLGNWTDIFRDVTKDQSYFDEFQYRYFTDPGFTRVKREMPPDLIGFITFSSTPDFSDLRRVLKVTGDEIKEYGHQAEDFILQCTFGGMPCNYSQFAWFPHDVYGNCYTFNRGSGDDWLWTSHTAGANSGLKLTLHVEQEEYLGVFGQSAGVRVAIHDNNEMPWPEDIGLTAKTGAATSFAIKQKHFERLGQPWGFCNSNYSSGSKGYDYSSLSCVKKCVQDYMVRYCNCVDTFDSEHPQCSMLNIYQEACRQIIHYFYQKALVDCDCLPHCKDRTYTSTVSMSTWPSSSYLNQLLKNLHSISPKTKKITNMASAQKNLALVSVYFETLNSDLVKESPGYQQEDFASDLGGLLGLYIGVSIITTIECLIFVKGVVLVMFSSLGRGKRDSRDISADESTENEREESSKL